MDAVYYKALLNAGRLHAKEYMYKRLFCKPKAFLIYFGIRDSVWSQTECLVV